MRSHTADNADKSRRAVVCEKKVVFFLRRRKTKGKVLYPVWNRTYPSFEDAVRAADIWAAGGGVMEPGQRAS